MATTQTQEFTTAGVTAWVAPAGVSCVFVNMIGAGGAGGGHDGSNPGAGQGGGGSGEFVIGYPVAVVAGNSFNVTVGAGGVGGQFTGGTGGNSTFGPITTTGGIGGGGAANSGRNGGKGGGLGGATFVSGSSGAPGAYETARFTGGGSGGSYGGSTWDGAPSLNGIAGGSHGTFIGGLDRSGCGGASSPWGKGGTGGLGQTVTVGGDYPTSYGNLPAAGSYGAGGGGAGGTGLAGSTASGGNGADGYVLLQWEAP